jgi:hypothetical protein
MPLVHFNATSASLTPACRKSYLPRSTSGNLSLAPRVSSSALQHMQIQRPFFSLLRLKQRLGSCTSLPKSPNLRVWLPSRWPELSVPLGVSFSSQHSWASPFKAFLSLGDRSLSFEKGSPLLRFPRNPLGFLLALQWLSPTESAVSLFCSLKV